MLQTIDSSHKELKEIINKFLDVLPTKDDVGSFFEERIKNQRNEATQTLDTINNEMSFKEVFSAVNNVRNKIATLSDSEMGVVRANSNEKMAFVGNDINSKSPITMRDARLQGDYGLRKNSADEIPEATIAVALGNLQGVLKIAQDSNAHEKHKKLVKSTAIDIFQHYRRDLLDNNIDQKARNRIVANMNYELAGALRKGNLSVGGQKIQDIDDKTLLKGIGQVRDLTNLDAEPHSSIVTVSHIGGGNNHVQATIPVKPLSKRLEKYYNEEKEWMEELNPFLKQSLNKGEYIDKITDGQHMISSQTPFPGIRNGAVEKSIVLNKEGEEIDNIQMLRSGTPAHNNGKKSNDIKVDNRRKDISSANVSHASALCGKRTVDATSLNGLNEKNIVSGVEDAVGRNDNEKMKYNNLPISVGNKAHNLVKIWMNFKKINKAASQLIQWISCKSGKDRTGAAITQNVLKSMKGLDGVDKDFARKSIVSAGHINATAANVGATIGINGTKIGNVFAGLSVIRLITGAKHSILRKFKAELSSDIASLNHVKTKAPKIPSPVLQQATEAVKSKNTPTSATQLAKKAKSKFKSVFKGIAG